VGTDSDVAAGPGGLEGVLNRVGDDGRQDLLVTVDRHVVPAGGDGGLDVMVVEACPATGIRRYLSAMVEVRESPAAEAVESARFRRPSQRESEGTKCRRRSSSCG